MGKPITVAVFTATILQNPDGLFYYKRRDTNGCKYIFDGFPAQFVNVRCGTNGFQQGMINIRSNRIFHGSIRHEFRCFRLKA